MKTLDELRSYYRTILLPELKVLEEERKKSLNKIIISATAVFRGFTVSCRYC